MTLTPVTVVKRRKECWTSLGWNSQLQIVMNRGLGKRHSVHWPQQLGKQSTFDNARITQNLYKYNFDISRPTNNSNITDSA